MCLSSLIGLSVSLTVGLTPHLATRTADVDWNVMAGDQGGSKFSSLKQINTGNVARLRPVWTFHTGEGIQQTPLQCTPLVVEGTMYLVTAKHKVVAIDPVTGKKRWELETQTDDGRSGHSRASRGLAYWSDGKPQGLRRLLFGTTDGRIVSIDAKKGEFASEFSTVDLRKELNTSAYVGVSAAPTIYRDFVFVGLATGESEGSAPGTIMAFSVKSGKRVWSFDVVPKVGEPGSETWITRGSDSVGAGGSWNGYSLDEKRGILFAATGSVAPDFDGAKRHGDNLFGNCVVALDAKSGKRLWHFQTVHHDVWDHDNASTPVLCSIKRNGKLVDVVAQVTKTGFCFVLDRVTGKPIYPVREVPAPASTLPDELTAKTQPESTLPPALCRTQFRLEDVTDLTVEGQKLVMSKLTGLDYGAKYLPPSRRGTVVAPGYWGGSPWSGASFDPRTQMLYVNTNDAPSIMAQPARYEFLTDENGYPGVKPPWGLLTAINLNTGRFAWQMRLGEYRELTQRGIPKTGTPNLGGTLATAGNLVFVGATCDSMFRAFDSRNGKTLWEYQLPASAYAAPCTYSIGGRQYVVIAASGGGYAKLFGFDKGPQSDTFVCFALPTLK